MGAATQHSSRLGHYQASSWLRILDTHAAKRPFKPFRTPPREGFLAFASQRIQDSILPPQTSGSSAPLEADGDVEREFPQPDGDVGHPQHMFRRWDGRDQAASGLQQPDDPYPKILPVHPVATPDFNPLD